MYQHNKKNTVNTEKISSSCSSCVSLEKEIESLRLELISLKKIIEITNNEVRNLQRVETSEIRPTLNSKTDDSTWVHVVSGPKGNIRNGEKKPLITKNKFSILEEEPETCNLPENQEIRKQPANTKGKDRRQQQVIVIGDSHTRGCAANLKLKTRKYNITGYVKPGATTDHIVDTTMDTENLTENDVVVFWGGTNDVGKNNSKQGLQNISKFVNKCDCNDCAP